MKTRLLPLVILLFCMSVAVFSQTTYYVTPNGLSSNNGSSFSSAMDLKTALNAAKAGDSVILQGGTYKIPYSAGNKNSLIFSKSGNSGNPITVSSYNNSIATIDFSFPELEWVQSSYGLSVTGSYWYFKGLKITRAGYQGAYVTGGYNTFENCIFYANRNTGLEINKGGHHTTVINCDAYYNYDPKKAGSMADGFGPKETQGAGNKFIGCRAWENSDDGYDCYNSSEIVTFENCWAFNNGIDVWHYSSPTFAGNGNGFKVGGNSKLANNKLTKCISFGHPGKGFDQNNNTGGLTLYNCTAYKNGSNFGLGNTLASGEKHILKNNVSLDGTVSLTTATETNNTWNSGFSVNSSDFESLNLSLATGARNSDGSLSETALFKPKSGSNLIDAGVNIGLPYSGSAPDLGAIEYGGVVVPPSTYTLSTNMTGSGTVSGAGTYSAGATATITASAASGWTFSKWSGDASGTNTSASINMTSNKSVTAVFIEDGTPPPPPTGDEIIHNFTESGTNSSFFDITGNLSTSKGTVTYAGLTLTQCLKLESSTSISFTTTQEGALTLVFNDNFNDGVKIDGTSKSVSSGILTTTLAAGSHKITKDNSANLYYISISNNGTNPNPVTYTLSTTINGQGSVNPSSGTYEAGTSVSITATPASGWQFDSWSGGSTSNPSTVVMNANKSITANFSLIPVNCDPSTITSYISVNGGAWNQTNSATLNEGGSVGFGPQPTQGGSWSWSGPNGFSSSSRDVDLTNVQTSQSGTYSVTHINDCGASSNSTINLTVQPVGGSITATIQENTTGFCDVDGGIDNNNSGFTGDGFANTDNSAGNGIDYKINAAGGSVTLKIQYASSSDRPAKIIVNNNTVVSSLSMPSTGSWTTWSSVSTTISLASGVNELRIEATGSDGLGNVDYISVTGSGVSAADCDGTDPDPVTYTLSTTINGQGSVNPSSGTYAEGTSVSMTATPASGWQFDSWSGGSTSNSATVVMNANKSITANFSEIISETGTISLSASAGDSQVSLSWSSSNISSGFEVYRDLDSDLAGRVRIATTSSTSYTDSDVSNGTTYYYSIKATDVNSTAVNSNVANATPQGILQDVEITLQENESGFCDVDGGIENNNSGFTGDGFANTDNATGTGVDWKVDFGSIGTYTFVFRYASSSDRPAKLIINGSTVVSTISFPSTGSWTTWKTVSVTASVSAGEKDVRLEATGSSGLGNIDYVSISGVNPQAVDCASQLKSAEGALSMTETENLNKMEIYPNPFSASATIRFSLNSPQQISFKIYDLTGRIVDEITKTSYDSGVNSIIYNNAGLKSGIYMLSIQNGAIINNKRLIIDNSY